MRDDMNSFSGPEELMGMVIQSSDHFWHPCNVLVVIWVLAFRAPAGQPAEVFGRVGAVVSGPAHGVRSASSAIFQGRMEFRGAGFGLMAKAGKKASGCMLLVPQFQV